MGIKIKIPQAQLKIRVAHLLKIDLSSVLHVFPTMGGKSYVAVLKKTVDYNGQFLTTYNETSRVFSIWEIVDCLPLDDLEIDKLSILEFTENFKEALEILDLPCYPNDLSELKQAYRKQAKSAHPDKGGSIGLFRQIKVAYDVLKRYHGSIFSQS
jgi:hypothetical protein